MINYPEIDPVAFSLGPLSVHWYGIMYLLGFLAAWGVALHRSKRPWSPVRKNQIEDLIVYSAFGVILGGRFGYVIFYNFEKWLSDPVWLLRIWEGGMSFHGGLIGVLLAIYIYSRKINQPFLALGDFVAPMVPIGLGLGRLGNFIGQELWGRPTDSWVAMVFPKDPHQLGRHPSQLYEFLLEGIVLFLVLMFFSRKPRPRGVISGLFLLGYGCFRFAVEFFREPDVGVAGIAWMTRGQTLCLPMMVFGIGLILWGCLFSRSDTKNVSD